MVRSSARLGLLLLTSAILALSQSSMPAGAEDASPASDPKLTQPVPANRQATTSVDAGKAEDDGGFFTWLRRTVGADGSSTTVRDTSRNKPKTGGPGDRDRDGGRGGGGGGGHN
jgi:hypothetical protein